MEYNFVSELALKWGCVWSDPNTWPDSWGTKKSVVEEKYNVKYFGYAEVLSGTHIYYDLYTMTQKNPASALQIGKIYVFAYYYNAVGTHICACQKGNGYYSVDKIDTIYGYDESTGYKAPMKALFQPKTDENGHQLYILVNGKYYAVYAEKRQRALLTQITHKSKDMHVKPYEEIDKSSFVMKKKQVFFDASSDYFSMSDFGNETELSGWEAITNAADSVAGFPPSGNFGEKYINTDNEISAYFGKSKATWKIHCGEWDGVAKEIRLMKGTQNVPVYAGVPIKKDFASSFSVIYTYSNEYKSVEKTVQTGLSLENIAIKNRKDSAFSEGDDVSFSYTYGNTLLTFEDSYFLAHCLDKGWAGRILPPNRDFKAGDIVKCKDLLDFFKGQKLKYDNGVYVPFSDTLLDMDLKVRCGNKTYDSDETFTIDDKAETVTFDLTLKGDYLASEKTSSIVCYVVGKSEDYVTSCELHGAEEHIMAGKELLIGNGAYVVFRNESGKEISRKNFSDEGFVISYPNGYGDVPPEGMLADAIQTMRFVVCPYGERRMTVDWPFTIDYFEKTLKKKKEPSRLAYFFGGTYGDSPKLDPEGMEVVAIFHANSEQLGKTSEEIIGSASLTFSDIDTTFKGETSTQSILFSCEIGGREAKGSVDITVTRYGIKRIEASGTDSTKYWDSGEDTFHNPTGITFKYLYTDGTTENAPNDGALRFYRKLDSGEPYGRLTSESIVSPSDGSLIYVMSTKTDVNGKTAMGSYPIAFKKDGIISVTLKSPISPYIGNKLSKIKEKAELVATYESGASKQISQSDWYFPDSSIIMKEKKLSANVKGELFDIPESSVEWKKPTAYIYFDLSSFPTSYMNKADAIDASRISMTLCYETEEGEECDFSQSLSYTKETSGVKEGKASVTCDALPDYVLDGSSAVSLTMTDEGTKITALTVKAYDTINAKEITDGKSVSITIVEIINIIGISIRNPKTSYMVGERFLNDSDGTIARIFFRDQNGNQRIFETPLRSDMAALNVYPAKGTRFSVTQDSREVTVTATTNYSIKASYDISIGSRYTTSKTVKHDLVAVKMKWNDSNEAYYLVGRDDTTIEESGKRVLKPGTDLEKLEVYGYLEDVAEPGKNARVILFDDYIPPVEGSNNITVKFPCWQEGNSDIINKTHFGILFGNNNARNRLFVSGNPDYPNMDWRSGMASSGSLADESMESGNFAYFEDTSSAVYGETDNAVVGYDIVANDKLLVLKGKSDKETTVYFRTPTTVTAINGSGTAVTGIDGETMYADEFALSKGNNSVAGVSPKGILNFNGDSLFISSDKQLMGLDLTGIVGDNQRYANTRSYYIDEDLRRENMDSAFLWSDNRYLFLALKDKAFVAHFELKSDSQYEWFPIDVSGISAFLKVGDTIYFGTYDGRLSRFTDSYYYDISKTFAGVGEAKVTEDDSVEKIIVSQEAMSGMKDGGEYYFKVLSQKGVTDEKSSIYYKWATSDNSDSSDCDFQISSEGDYLTLVCRKDGTTDDARMREIKSDIGEKREVYLNSLNQTDLHMEGFPDSPLRDSYGEPFYLKKTGDPDSDRYELYDQNGAKAKVSTLWRFSFCKTVSLAKIVNPDRKACTFQLSLDGKVLDLVRYHNQPLSNSFVAEIREYKPVEAFMITKPYTMGRLDYLKTIWSVTITNDTNIPSEMEFCSVSNKTLTEKMKTIARISKDSLGLDMDEVDFKSMDFEKNIVPRTYTRNRVVSNIKFASFGIRNLKGTDCVLSSMSLTYTLPYKSYGD